jgi:hypothetical protein
MSYNIVCDTPQKRIKDLGRCFVVFKEVPVIGYSVDILLHRSTMIKATIGREAMGHSRRNRRICQHCRKTTRSSAGRVTIYRSTFGMLGCHPVI